MGRAVFVLAVAHVIACNNPQKEPTAAPLAETPTVTVASYNVLVDLAGNPETLRTIDGLGADVVFLQEVSDDWAAAIRDRLTDRFPFMEFLHRNGHGGLAILSRYPLERAERLAETVGAYPAFQVIVHSPIGRVQVLNVHLFPPYRWRRELGWMGAYLESQQLHVREIEIFYRSLDPRLPTLVVGDFNEGSAGRAVQWLRARGFASSVDESVPTWRWSGGATTLRMQLDHVLHDPRLRVLEAQVPERGRSDHLPVIVTLARAARSPAP